MADTTVLINGRQLKIVDNGDGTYSLGVSASVSVDVSDLLQDDTFTNRLGDVTASPTANTVLARLKDILTGIVLAAGENHAGMVSGFTTSVEVIPTVTASSAYSANDVIGGLMTFNLMNRASGKGVVLQSILLKDWANQKPAGTLYLFNDNPTASTYTDHGALTIHADDRAKWKRDIQVAASDWTTRTIGGASVAACDLQGKCGGVIVPVAQAIYGIFVTTSTPTFAATTNFSVSLGTLG